MATWQLSIWTPDGATLLRTFDNAGNAGGIGGFEVERDAAGDPLVLTFDAVPALTPNLDLRNIVQLKVDGTPVFWGYLETTWNANIQHPRRYQALGGRKLVQYALMDQTAYNTPTSLTTIYQSLAGSLLPSAITYDPARVASVSVTAVLRPSEGARLDQVFDALASMMGSPEWRWGVDANGTFYFEHRDAVTNLSGALVHYDHEGADRLVTGVTFVFGRDYTGAPIAWSYAGATDPTYEMHRSYTIDPDSVLSVVQPTNIFAPRGGSLQGEYWDEEWKANNDTGYLTDYSTQTRWHSWGELTSSSCQLGIGKFGLGADVAPTNPIMLRIRAELLAEPLPDGATGITVELWGSGLNPKASWSLGRSVDTILDVRGYEFTSVRVYVTSPCDNICTWDIAVYELMVYEATARSEAVARSFLQDPQNRPTSAVWPGYVAPTLYVDDGGGAQLADGWTHTLQVGRWETAVHVKPVGDASARAVINYVNRRVEDARITRGR